MSLYGHTDPYVRKFLREELIKKLVDELKQLDREDRKILVMLVCGECGRMRQRLGADCVCKPLVIGEAKLRLVTGAVPAPADIEEAWFKASEMAPEDAQYADDGGVCNGRCRPHFLDPMCPAHGNPWKYGAR